MSLCPLSRILAPLALAALVVVGVARAETPAKPEKLVHKVYQVADLVVPIPGMTTPAAAAMDFAFPVAQCSPKPCCAEKSGCCAEKPTVTASPCTTAPATCDQQLMKLIRASIASDSWAGAGGPGTIEYMPIGMALVVTQTPEVQEQVAELLDRLRRMHDLQVALEVRMMFLGDCLFEKIAGDFGLLRQPTALLDGRGVSELMERVQGERASNITQTPKVTTFNGQEATVRVCDERFFVTGLSTVLSKGQPVLVPVQNQPYSTGFTMTVRPSVTPDRRNVLLKLEAELAELTDANVPLFPVTTFITPVFEGGAHGKPVPFTQFLQQPTIMKRGITKMLGIPDGQSAIFYAGRGMRTVVDVDYCPILGHIPFVCELFKTETRRQESDHLIFLVTPRVIASCEQKACAAKDCDERKCGVTSECRPACAAPAVQAGPAPCPVAAPAVCATEQLPMPVVKPCATPVLSCPGAAVPCAAECQVKTEVVILSLDESYFNRPEAAVWSDLSPKACDGKPAFLSPEEAKRFTRLICDNGGEVRCRPQVMTVDGQKAQVNIGGEREFAVGLRMVHCDGKFLPEVQRERRAVGTSLTITPTVCADQRFVRLALCAECSRVSSHAEAGCKVTAHVTPADGSAPQKVTLDPPTIDVQQIETAISFPFGRTALLYGCAEKDDLGRTRRCAILITPDLINAPANVTRHAPPMPPCAPLAVYAAAPVVMPHPPYGYSPPPAIAEEQAVPPTPANPKLARLIARYREACAEGRTNAARKLAAKCLEIDPTCFARD